MAVHWLVSDDATAEHLNMDLNQVYHNFARTGTPAGTATITIGVGEESFIVNIAETSGLKFEIQDDSTPVFTYDEGTGKFTIGKDILIADGKSIGQVAGPLITFDDTGNTLKIGGCDVGIGVVPVVGNKLEVALGATERVYVDGGRGLEVTKNIRGGDFGYQYAVAVPGPYQHIETIDLDDYIGYNTYVRVIFYNYYSGGGDYDAGLYECWVMKQGSDEIPIFRIGAIQTINGDATVCNIQGNLPSLDTSTGIFTFYNTNTYDGNSDYNISIFPYTSVSN